MSKASLCFVQVTIHPGGAREYLIATADRRFRLKTADLGEAERFITFLKRRGYREPSRPEDNFPDLPGFDFDIYGGEIYEDGELRRAAEFEWPPPGEE
jgi:hypothetical protein